MAREAVFNELLSLIGRYGWAVRHVAPRVGEEGCMLSYTVGLRAMLHPEIVMQGLPAESAHGFLNDIGHQVKDGQRFTPGLVTTDLTENGLPVTFLTVQDTSELAAIEQVYGHVDALQLVWADASAHFPGSETTNSNQTSSRCSVPSSSSTGTTSNATPLEQALMVPSAGTRSVQPE